MAKYLIIKNIEILKANAHPAWYLVGPPALTAYHGFIQALLLNLINDNESNEFNNLILHEGFAVVHHEFQMLGSMNKYGNLFLPNKISSSHAYDKDDYVKSTTKLASQPTASCNLKIDLIIRLPKELEIIDDKKIRDFLFTGVIAGGKINFANKSVEPEFSITDNYSDVIKKINKGFYIIDRHDLLKSEDGKKSLELLLDKTNRLKDKSQKRESWLVPNTVGYLCLSDFQDRSNSRSANPVAYAEPLVTLTQYCSVRNTKEIPFWIWQSQVTGNGKQIFLLKEEKNESN